MILILICYFLHIYICHGVMSGAEAYSSPSVVMSSKYKGQRYMIDDYREAYYWLRMNTPQDAVIMSWWDYGYQITGFSNRTTLVDNNTWNNTHIATVGLAMSSPEHEAYEVCDRLDTDYVLVIYGGNSHYSGDDINKFLWMVRIGGGVYPHIKEENYLSRYGYRTDSSVTPTMRNSLMYRLAYYRTWQVDTAQGKPKGWDTVRDYLPGFRNYKLNFFEEAFSSDKWIVRIFKRKQRNNRESIELYKEGEYKKYLVGGELAPELLKEYKYAKKVKK